MLTGDFLSYHLLRFPSGHLLGVRVTLLHWLLQSLVESMWCVVFGGQCLIGVVRCSFVPEGF